MSRIVVLVFTIVALGATTACSPEVGSDRWCANMRDKPKGDWTASEAADYAKSCVFKSDSGK